MRRTTHPVRTYLTKRQIKALKAKAHTDDTSVAKLVTAAVLAQYEEDLREADAVAEDGE